MGQLSGAMQGAFGQQTDAEKAQGPNQGLSGGQQFARQALQGGIGGLGKGLQQQQPGNMQRPAMPPIQAPQQPLVDPSMFGMGKPKNPFFGQ